MKKIENMVVPVGTPGVKGLMGTEIIQFGLRRAEKTRFEVVYPILKNPNQNLLSKECPTKRLGLGLKGQKAPSF